MNIVIIGQNEASYINRMLFSLKDYPYKRIWVLDRCTDDSAKILTEHNEFYVETPKYLTGRQTSFARNLGLCYCDKDADVLFLDGDRYITEGTIEGLKEKREEILLLKLDKDHRDNVDFNRAYGHVHNGFYSCGVFFKREAINKVIAYQNELFRIDMQDEWGVEDVSLGDICYHLKLSCNIYEDCRLYGEFTKMEISWMSMLKRFMMRDKLEVNW